MAHRYQLDIPADSFFKEEMEIMVKDVTEKTLEELIQLVGPGKFSKFFSVERWIAPTARLTEEFHNLKNKADFEPLIKQRKPSIKTK